MKSLATFHAALATGLVVLAFARCAPAAARANKPLAGRFIRVESGAGPAHNFLHFAELQVFTGGRNVAVGKTVKASSTMGAFRPERAVDGTVEYAFGQDASMWHSARDRGGEWWELDLGATVAIDKVVLYNRLDCCQERLDGAVLTVLTARRAPAHRQVLRAGRNPIEMVFYDRPLPPIDLRARTLEQRMRDVAPRFSAPSDDPAAVMPVGTGELSAMLRYGDAYEIHLSRSDFFAIEEKPYHYSPTIHSPGHVRLSFGITRDAIRSFEQRIDYRRGSVVLELTAAGGKVRAETFGIMGGDTLVVAVEDSRRAPEAKATFAIWRDAMEVSCARGIAAGCEVHDYDERGRRVAPGASIGASDRMYQLGVATEVAFAGDRKMLVADGRTDGGGGDASATLSARALPARYWLVISCATTYDGRPRDAAHAQLAKTVRRDKTALLKEHLTWWETFWESSWVDLHGEHAERLMGLWYTGYYSYASAASARVAPKFNGGPGLIRRDERSWGWGYWWQNTRELMWPMFAGNRMRYAREYLDFYDRQFMSWKDATARKGKIGLRMWECPGPLKPGVAPPRRRVSRYDAAALARAVEDRTMENVKSGYNARSLAQSVELTQLMFDYLEFSGDEEYLESTAAPWLKEATLFYLSYLRKGDDGLYHSEVSDSAEMWWRVKDPITDLAAARYCFWLVLNHGERLGYERAFLRAVRERLDNLPEMPTGFWKRRRATPADRLPPGTKGNVTIVGEVDRSVDCFAPAAGLYDDRVVHNQENPELYIVFPFAQVDARSPKPLRDRAVTTFRKRFHPNWAGWSQCPIQAARLRLDDTVDVIMDHVRRHQKYPYGGWNSPGHQLEGSKSGVTDVPYFDTVGVNLTALQEMLLQSHALCTAEKTDLFSGGPILALPAVRPDWAGRFKLRARGGFLVTVEFQRGRVVVGITVESERGGTLELVNPFERCRVTRRGRTVLTTAEPVVSLQTSRGDVLAFANAAARR